MSEWHGTADVPLANDEPRLPRVEGDREPSSDKAAAPVNHSETAATAKDFERYRSRRDRKQTNIESALVPASEELLHSRYVTLPAAEVALLTRIAEVAARYSQKHLFVYRLELFQLANEWRKEWQNSERNR